MIRDILWGLAAFTVYCLIVLGRPHMRCWRCFGKRVVKAQIPGPRGRRKTVKCPVCKARGIARLPLAGPVHRMFWAVAGDQLLARRRDEVAALLDNRKDDAA